jgi:D-3-phosphoglycerate dehydrogenase
MSAGPAAGAAGTARGRILVTPRSLTSAELARVPELAPLRAAGYELRAAPAGQLPTEEQLLSLVPGCVGWLAGVEPITARVIGAATDLRVISRNGAGVDSVDLDAARRSDVRVVRAAGANARGVAELTLALSLAALRHVVRSHAALRAGAWRRWAGRELADLTIGVVGLGAVGRSTAALFHALGASVVGHDPLAGEVDGVRRLSLYELVSASEIVTLHCPPAPDGTPIVDRALLKRARPGTVLVNTARSALVDGDAVLDALESGILDAYAVDAFDSEPPEPTPLLQHERVITTPHIGGYTDASVRRATAQAVTNLLRELEGPR